MLKKLNEKILVTQPDLPELESFIPLLRKIWKSKNLTNGGPYHKELEEKLCKYLNLNHISLFSNGTIALVTALQCLKITGEVITTPYSFVATSHSLLWNNIKPIFVDIEKNSPNIDPIKIEQAITSRTTAILAVHCYGHPCRTLEIKKIAEKYNLKVIYDAAHAFDVRLKGQSILENGDLSILSFHATKVFNTFEGGAIVCPDLETKIRIDQLKNFGFVNELTVIEPGINGKMSEFNAALGILQLKKLKQSINKRKKIDQYYRKNLRQIKGISFIDYGEDEHPNYSYFPIMIQPEYHTTRDQIFNKLRDNNIYARRYFYPLISEFPMYNKLSSSSPENLTNAHSMANKIICLPIHPFIESKELDLIIKLLS